MMFIASALLLATPASELPIITGHPFVDTQTVNELVQSSWTAVPKLHDARICGAYPVVVIELVLPVNEKPADIKIVDPGCEILAGRAEYIAMKIGHLPRSAFIAVEQPTRYQVRIRMQHTADEPAN